MNEDFVEKYAEHSVDSVMEYFCDGFKLPEGRILVRREWYLDQHKGKVIFRLVTKESQK